MGGGAESAVPGTSGSSSAANSEGLPQSENTTKEHWTECIDEASGMAYFYNVRTVCMPESSFQTIFNMPTAPSMVSNASTVPRRCFIWRSKTTRCLVVIALRGTCRYQSLSHEHRTLGVDRIELNRYLAMRQRVQKHGFHEMTRLIGDPLPSPWFTAR